MSQDYLWMMPIRQLRSHRRELIVNLQDIYELLRTGVRASVPTNHVFGVELKVNHDKLYPPNYSKTLQTNINGIESWIQKSRFFATALWERIKINTRNLICDRRSLWKKYRFYLFQTLLSCVTLQTYRHTLFNEAKQKYEHFSIIYDMFYLCWMTWFLFQIQAFACCMCFFWHVL